MYIWVILGTFMVALYSFNLSHRPDMKELITVPQAEALIGKMIVQHKAAMKYIVDHKPPNNGQDVPSFFPGELKPDTDLKNYLPYGYVNNRTFGDFRTLIYCLNRDSANLSAEVSGCSSGNLISCCADSRSRAYMVTFGCVPRKWRNVRTGKPRAEFLTALRGIAVASTEIGYVERLTSAERASVDNVFHSEIGLRTRWVPMVSIPQFIVNDSLSEAELSFSDVCGLKSVDEEGNSHEYACDKCLAYISLVTFHN